MQIQEALQTGTILKSDDRFYEIKKVLGQGGFGITYLATSIVDVDNIPIEAQFAIKEHYISSMNERQGTSVAISNVNNTAEIKESIDSFIVEAQRLNKLSLNHPGIVRVNECFRANGTAYYVMEYIKGQSLREFVKHSSGGRLSEEEALKLFRPIAETIGYLHENKVTHLDIKPDNILIRENGQPVIIDFGLSKHYSSKGTPTSTIKAAGCSAGYSPMEQYVGITTFTPEADIYALAATLLYMLTGKDPIISTEITPDVIFNSLPEEVSEQTKEAVVKGMAKLKEDRMNNIQGFFTDTDSEASFTTISAPEDTNKTKKKKPASQKAKHKNSFIRRMSDFCYHQRIRLLCLTLASIILLIILCYFDKMSISPSGRSSLNIFTEYSKQYPNDILASYCDRLNKKTPFNLWNIDYTSSLSVVQQVVYKEKEISFLIHEIPNPKFDEIPDFKEFFKWVGSGTVNSCHLLGKDVFEALLKKNMQVRFNYYTNSPDKIDYTFILTQEKMKEQYSHFIENKDNIGW